jgi:hypothetical protein
MSTIHPILMTVAALALAAPATASAELLASYDGRRVVENAGVQAWSQQQGDERFALMVRSQGRTAQAPVGVQPVPFAVSLGTDGNGRRLAGYPRCGLGPYHAPADCRLVAYDLRRGLQRPLAAGVVRGTDQVATLDAPAWRPAPKALGLTRACNG